jgi:hypothetical protein
MQPALDDQLDLLRLVATRLDAAGLAYMLSGSLALGYYAQPRMTRDIDIVVELTSADVATVVALFEGDFYCDADAVRRAVETRRLVNLVHGPSAQKVDLIVRKDTPYRRTEFGRRQQRMIEGFSVWMVTAEDLLLSKLVWASESGSELQLRDARDLAALVGTLDWPYLEYWALDLGVADRLRECRR